MSQFKARPSTLVSSRTEYDIPVISSSLTLKIIGILVLNCVLVPLLMNFLQLDYRWITTLLNSLLLPALIIRHLQFKQRKTQWFTAFFLGLSFLFFSYTWLYLGLLF